MVDANKQAIAYVYGHADPRDARQGADSRSGEENRGEYRQAAKLARQVSVCAFIGAGIFGVVVATCAKSESQEKTALRLLDAYDGLTRFGLAWAC